MGRITNALEKLRVKCTEAGHSPKGYTTGDILDNIAEYYVGGGGGSSRREIVFDPNGEVLDAGEVKFIRVSDTFISKAELEGSLFTYTYDGDVYINDISFVGESKSGDSIVLMDQNAGILCTNIDNAEIEGLVIPHKGTYFMVDSNDQPRVDKLILHDENEFYIYFDNSDSSTKKIECSQEISDVQKAVSEHKKIIAKNKDSLVSNCTELYTAVLGSFPLFIGLDYYAYNDSHKFRCASISYHTGTNDWYYDRAEFSGTAY